MHCSKERREAITLLPLAHYHARGQMLLTWHVPIGHEKDIYVPITQQVVLVQHRLFSHKRTCVLFGSFFSLHPLLVGYELCN